MPDCAYIPMDVVSALILCVNGLFILGIFGAFLKKNPEVSKLTLVVAYVIALILFNLVFTRHLVAYTPENVQTYCENGVINQPQK